MMFTLQVTRTTLKSGIQPDPTMDCALIFYLLENYSKYFDDLLALGRAIVALWATGVMYFV